MVRSVGDPVWPDSAILYYLGDFLSSLAIILGEKWSKIVKDWAQFLKWHRFWHLGHYAFFKNWDIFWVKYLVTLPLEIFSIRFWAGSDKDDIYIWKSKGKVVRSSIEKRLAFSLTQLLFKSGFRYCWMPNCFLSK